MRDAGIRTRVPRSTNDRTGGARPGQRPRAKAKLSAAPFIAVVTGMRAEARIASGMAGVRTIVAGTSQSRLQNQLEQAIADGARGIMSFGVSGGICPTVSPGRVLVAREIVHGSSRFATCPDWSAWLLTHIPDAHHAVLAGSEKPVACIREKAAIRSATAAVTVDMESHIAARLANRHDLPFAALRVVADGHDRPLPASAIAGFGADGEIDVLAVIRSLAKRPHELPALMRLSADSRAAFASLLRCGSRLSAASGGIALAPRPSLGLADLS